MSEPAIAAAVPLRCAIYTRKSTEEGLDKEFNALDAQREAAEAFILSQRQEGWLALPYKYDDGGFTGANMERPALRKLLADIAASRIGCVVVYKVDRLSRSLLDFARLMAVFEEHGVSFVSVTQQFNTRTSVGRLTLNILLSFAAFERDLISERTRDKKAAAKRKGQWTGGYLPLGYDLDPGGGKLVVNEAEAEQVRTIFELYVASGSLTETLEQVQRRGCQTKTWITRQHKPHAGAAFNEDSLRRLLANAVYAGGVQYQEKTYRGEHRPIVAARVWRRAQQLLQSTTVAAGHRQRNEPGAMLQGILHCGACGKPMSHTVTCRAERRYRYYICRSQQCTGQSIAAAGFELSVVEQLEKLTRGGSAAKPASVDPQSQPGPVPEIVTQVRDCIEKVSYDRRSGAVLLRLRDRKRGSDARSR